ncbi:MAG: hypothetical protein WCF19_05720 [Chlamydiales bacterium]
MKKLKLFSLLFLINFLVSCGYRWQPSGLEGGRPTITVPFVKGDEDGSFTSEIISCLSSSGLADVVSHGGEYELRVSILGEESEKIGFRVDPQKVDGKIRKNLLAAEGRRRMTIEAALWSRDQCAFGPYKISADAEYDYIDGDSIQDLTFVNPAGVVVTVLPFSLGQLEPVESAEHAATRPLFARLARKIADAISSNW